MTAPESASRVSSLLKTETYGRRSTSRLVRRSTPMPGLVPLGRSVTLLVPQSGHRVYAGGPLRGDEAGAEGDGG